MEAIRLLKRRPWGIIGAAILLTVIVIAALAPAIAPFFWNEISIDARLQPPGGGHLLGTDNLGRDIFSRVVYGSRPYVVAGLIATGTSAVPGVVLGFLSARIGRKTDSIIRGIIFVPAALMLLLVLFNLVSVFVRVFAPPPLLFPVRYPESITVIVGLLLSLVLLPCFHAAAHKAFSRQASGRGLASLFPLILVSLGVAVGMAVPMISRMSYYGLGVPPPLPEWGNMISGSGRTYMLEAPWMAIIPTIAIAVTCLGLVIFGLALREVWFPRLH
ncbi:MAG: hypothetical protein Q8Q07_06785 [Dehalococcoidales bacterium]|nr:hypothetical protein [Dehalococcoidales bacterium]